METTVILLTLIASIAILAAAYWTKLTGKVPYIKRSPAVEMIDKAMARAVETGRPVHFTLGPGSTYAGNQAANTFAGLTALDYIARAVARLKARIFITVCKSVTLPAIDQVMTAAYVAEGVPQDYNRESVVYYLGEEVDAYNAAILGIFGRERPAVNIVGAAASGSAGPVLTGMGAYVGAMQIGLSAAQSEDVVFPICMDYATIGDEHFAVAAYLSKDPALLGGLLGLDIVKIIAIATFVIITISALIGNTWLLDIFKM
jgi:hypothetical protein